MKIVFDIETAGYDFETLSESQQEYLLRYVEQEPDETKKMLLKEEAIRYTSLYPLTSKVIAIAMLNIETGGTLILYEGEESEDYIIEEKNLKYKSVPEEKMLTLFWEYVKKTEQVITFNGRLFDVPFLMIRSAMLKIKPTKNLIGNRYDKTTHIDLLDQFTFHGLTRKFNLDFYCKAFNIESPKSKGVTGMEVKELYSAGRIKDIAVYCGEDVKATYELYKIWNEYLNL